ncbi:neuronal acetylcholine receptor subunit beta-3 isoform X2 [Octopus sinensis]|uniref:Neuronal acetylcholine receptor subunit beta-3 isoform X2 n=1 Tax=Octopus sinensis TaxID=2607531 RepID=A0A7E6EZQ0_9MOLL|nr:neuronal acetylcholine receptor subunit beta-3 isoform X2 [Octopus sinensis]
MAIYLTACVTYILLLLEVIHGDSEIERSNNSADFHGVHAAKLEDTQRLHRDLFHRYNTMVRPIQDQDKPVTINMDLYLMSITSLDEKEQTMRIMGYLHLDWTDHQLKWAPDRYGGLKHLVLPTDKVWTPQLLLGNSASNFKDLTKEKLQLKVYWNGEVEWSPGGQMTVSCRLNITSFPFDRQTCSIVFGSWTEDANAIVFKPRSEKIEFDHYVENNEWEIESTMTGNLKVNHQSRESEKTYSNAVFSIKLKRRRTFHIVSTYIPFVLLALLNLAAHVVPVMSGEKLMLATTTLLAYAVLLNDINRKIPGNSATTSVLGVCLTMFLVISTATVWISAIQLRIMHSKSSFPSSFSKSGLSTSSFNDETSLTVPLDATLSTGASCSGTAGTSADKLESYVMVDYLRHQQSSSGEEGCAGGIPPAGMENFINAIVSQREQRKFQHRRLEGKRRKFFLSKNLGCWFSLIATLLTILTALAPLFVIT